MDALLNPLVNSNNTDILQSTTDRLQKAYQAKHDENLLLPNPRIPAGAKEPARAQSGRLHVPAVFPTQPSDTMATNTLPQLSTTDSSTTGNDIEMADIKKEESPVVLTEDEQS
ncbi:hypothetical protein SARC_00141 [Sphaeroforma arctica JP610]|uniref:Uncharacterized protein n=1 Tax=Sphaeroforma arctica JP610 TaxID=667725 RepID=A0A0L0GFY7_9EUKA|nr:hypothetical protein SARC_00141 [Sphaeroforma arctica JP610]KNC87769.1 hypothetical protein SARC_00141 [Sphaeroforma arctica JP610]|eukprot:XP_014161671.1 hypothetical protein SARC_00141 [Sphaeroforma arctica JP610]